MVKFARYIREGEVFPKGYGVAWVNADRLGVTTMPIPLNFIAGNIRKLFLWLKSGDWYKTGYDKGYSLGYESGRRYAFEQYKHHARKEIEEEVRKEIADQFGFSMEIFINRNNLEQLTKESLESEGQDDNK